MSLADPVIARGPSHRRHPTSVAEVQARMGAGESFKFLFFWGHNPEPDGRPSHACFSQWFAKPFVVGDVSYPTAEHFMMAEKARLFGDADSLAKILRAKTPGEAKALGRSVANFSEDAWEQQRFAIVCNASYAKFSQATDLKNFLLATGTKILVEASPFDKIWGIGLSARDEKIHSPNLWEGLNLLGFALMAARERLREDLSL